MTELAEPAGGAAPGLGLGHGALERAMDIVVSLTLIIVLSPLLLLLFVLVRATSAGPALFRQERLGRGMRPFIMLKLRTMHADNDDRKHRAYVTAMLSAGQPAEQAEQASGEPAAGDGLFKLNADPRVTRLGTWLRRSSLDELPQLFNVLRGQMSLVGPRPVLPWEAPLFGPAYQRRFDVKPGLTGLWQVSGRSRLTMPQALELDVEYAIRHSVALYLIILARTVPAVFRGEAR